MVAPASNPRCRCGPPRQTPIGAVAPRANRFSAVAHCANALLALWATPLIAEARDYLRLCHARHARHMVGRAFAYPSRMVTFCIYA
jgi:hypothetical protein